MAYYNAGALAALSWSLLCAYWDSWQNNAQHPADVPNQADALAELTHEFNLRCRHCHLRIYDHAQDRVTPALKCLFEPTTYEGGGPPP